MRIPHHQLHRPRQAAATDGEYRALPAKVAQWVLKQVDAAWKSYFAALAEWNAHPEKFTGHPRLPKYLDKDGRNVLVYTDSGHQSRPQECRLGGSLWGSDSRRHETRPMPRLRRSVSFPCPPITSLKSSMSREPTPNPALDPALIASIDIGVNVLAAITSNQPGFTPLLVNGRPLKRCNQWYNKRRAKLQAQLPERPVRLARHRSHRPTSATARPPTTCMPPAAPSSICWFSTALVRWS